MNSREIAEAAVRALEDKKGMDIKLIDISNVSVMADCFVIASGGSSNQVQALCDNVEEEVCRKMGVEVKGIEGYNGAAWVLMDLGDVIVHIFDKESRSFYDLERIWKDGKLIEL